MDSDQKDIIDFLNSKNKEKTNLDNVHILILFLKSIKNSLLITYSDLKDINSCLICKELIIKIFWVLTSYTSNTKLILFMIDRSILLFNEYLKVSKQYGIESVNITEVKTFIINKTIGPIKNFKLKNNNYSNLQLLSNILNNFITNFFQKFIETDIQMHLDNIINIVTNISYKLYIHNNLDLLNIGIDKMLNSKPNNIIYYVNKFKLLSEVLLMRNYDYRLYKFVSDQIDNSNFDIHNYYFDVSEEFNNNEYLIYLKNEIIKL